MLVPEKSLFASTTGSCLAMGMEKTGAAGWITACAIDGSETDIKFEENEAVSENAGADAPDYDFKPPNDKAWMLDFWILGVFIDYIPTGFTSSIVFISPILGFILITGAGGGMIEAWGTIGLYLLTKS